MRIAYFTESLPPVRDGVSHTLSQVAESLQSSNIEFHFISPFKPNKSYSRSHRVKEIISMSFPLHSNYRVSNHYCRTYHDI